MSKEKRFAGADEQTLSKAHYFSWISSTNEGSTERQTLINLDYFRYLSDTFGMRLDIYAWDAGNLDGSNGTYETLDSDKLKKQDPDGYRNVVRKAAERGARMGVWCGPDGFGDTAESAARRRELLVSLCRDDHFALFKCDSVCGELSEENISRFIDTLIECRKYSPDLILLNHRLELGAGMKYATTFLWEGEETYVDALIGNHCTAPHHRAFMFRRGNTPRLQRLAEDHGVCLSSCLDYFEDEMIWQAFGRDLLLAPEIYGNPWLLRDDEQAVLARVFNLHRRYNDSLLNGMLLDEQKYGANAVARGSDSERLLVTGNPSWEEKTLAIKLDEEIGLRPCDEVFVGLHHPYEQCLGVYRYGETVDVPLLPFRACLAHVCAREFAPPMLTGCRYRVLHDVDASPDRVEVVSTSGRIGRTDDAAFAISAEPFDHTLRAPRLLGQTHACPLPADAEALMEATLFAADNDSLERRSLRRSGSTQIPEVQRARDAFFAQDTYRYRGCDSAALFDGDTDTFFDGHSRQANDEGFRVRGGCLRVDFGRVYQADSVRLTYFESDEETFALHPQTITPEGSFSTDLRRWSPCCAGTPAIVEANATMPEVMHRVHNIRFFSGKRKQVHYAIGGALRYLRIPQPVDRLYSVELLVGGTPVPLEATPQANNLMPPPDACQSLEAQTLCVRIPRALWREGCYLAVALDGVHGVEGAYAAAMVDHTFRGCPDRATSYPANAWEVGVRTEDAHYTYYLPVTQDMTDMDINVYVLFCDAEHPAFACNVYLCDEKREETGLTLELHGEENAHA